MQTLDCNSFGAEKIIYFSFLYSISFKIICFASSVIQFFTGLQLLRRLSIIMQIVWLIAQSSLQTQEYIKWCQDIGHNFWVKSSQNFWLSMQAEVDWDWLLEL